jgi:hypothetical protein
MPDLSEGSASNAEGFECDGVGEVRETGSRREGEENVDMG